VVPFDPDDLPFTTNCDQRLQVVGVSVFERVLRGSRVLVAGLGVGAVPLRVDPLVRRRVFPVVALREPLDERPVRGGFRQLLAVLWQVPLATLDPAEPPVEPEVVRAPLHPGRVDVDEFPGVSRDREGSLVRSLIDYRIWDQHTVKGMHCVVQIMTGDSLRHPETAEGRDGVEVAASDDLSVEDYLRRIGVDPESVETPDLETLATLQRAHVLAVPFENLSIVGDPAGEHDGAGVVLSIPAIYEKLVERERGGYCFELNGLFHWLLVELGYDVDRIAARVTSDGQARPPANHYTNVVELDRRYVVDVGTGAPMIRHPLPLDGTPQTDDVGVSWRIAESDRPDETFCTQFRFEDDEEWSTRYVFSDVARELQYFEATNDFLQCAPESPFTSGAFAVLATAEGHRKLSGTTCSERTAAGELEYSVDEDEWLALLERKFDITPDGTW